MTFEPGQWYVLRERLLEFNCGDQFSRRRVMIARLAEVYVPPANARMYEWCQRAQFEAPRVLAYELFAADLSVGHFQNGTVAPLKMQLATDRPNISEDGFDHSPFCLYHIPGTNDLLTAGWIMRNWTVEPLDKVPTLN